MSTFYYKVTVNSGVFGSAYGHTEVYTGARRYADGTGLFAIQRAQCAPDRILWCVVRTVIL